MSNKQMMLTTIAERLSISANSNQSKLRAFILEPILTPTVEINACGGNWVCDNVSDDSLNEGLESKHLYDDNHNGWFYSEWIGGVKDDNENHLNGEKSNDYDLQKSELSIDSFTYEVVPIGEIGQVSIDFLYDGGKYQGELALFSLDGMEDLEPGSREFIETAATRAASNTEMGYIIISDRAEGVKACGYPKNWNSGEYLGEKSLTMRSGDLLGLILVPNGTVKEVIDNSDIGCSKTPLFSLSTVIGMRQISYETEDYNIFTFDAVRNDRKWFNEDYNDFIFKVKGATGDAIDLDNTIVGSNANNRLDGGNGNDVIKGGNGNDILLNIFSDTDPPIKRLKDPYVRIHLLKFLKKFFERTLRNCIKAFPALHHRIQSLYSLNTGLPVHSRNIGLNVYSLNGITYKTGIIAQKYRKIPSCSTIKESKLIGEKEMQLHNIKSRRNRYMQQNLNLAIESNTIHKRTDENIVNDVENKESKLTDILQEYYTIAKKQNSTEAEEKRFLEILEQAETDEELSARLNRMDNLIHKELGLEEPKITSEQIEHTLNILDLEISWMQE